MKYKYTTGEDVKWAVEFDSNWDTDEPEAIAENAAMDFMNRDECESKWPKTFTIFDMNDFEIGKFKVELESEPVFYAHAATKAEEERDG